MDAENEMFMIMTIKLFGHVLETLLQLLPHVDEHCLVKKWGCVRHRDWKLTLALRNCQCGELHGNFTR
jgi:hypothetical protein